jgi:RNA polymerase sigma-70 factor (ECF subfamily)
VEQERDLLTNRLLAGERAAAEELIDKYYEQIYLFFRRMGHSRQTSEDLTQECFIRVWQHIGQLKYARATGSWLYNIAGNLSKSYWRRNRRFLSVDSGLELIDAKHQDTPVMEREEELLRLKEMVFLLPFKLRGVVVLHYLQQLTIMEAAEAMGVSEGTIKSRLHKALRVLKKKMA